MKEFWNWIVKNFSNLFTVLGILLTLYFSVFYVPGYIKENENERNRSINTDLVETIQEIVYNNHILTEQKINSLIQGKELRYNTEYQYSIEELLIQTEDAFMSNKFIPLDQRIEIVNRLDSIKSSIKPVPKPVESKATTKSFIESKEYVSVLISIIIGILATMLGSFSFFSKLRKEKKQSIDIEVEKEKEGIQEQIIKAVNFENMIADILAKNNLKYEKVGGKDTGFDFAIRLDKEKRLFISTKYMSSGRSINLDTINKMTYPYKHLDAYGIIILNKADNRLIHYLNQFSKEVDSKVKLIVSSNFEEIETEIVRYINNFR